MTRAFFWTALAVAMTACTIGFDNRAMAQESAGAAAEADANVNQTDQASTDASAEAGSQSAEASPSAESTTSETATEPAESASATQDSATQDSASEAASTSDQPADASLPPPTGPAVEQPASTQTSTEERSLIDDRQLPDRDASATGRTSVDVDASVQGRAEADVQRRGDVEMRGRDSRSRDMRSGIRFRAGRDRGLAIDTIERNSVFFGSGLRRGDIVVSIGDRPVRSEADFMGFVSVHRGDRIPVVVLRDGRRETVYVTYRDAVAAQQPDIYQEQIAVGSRPYLGVVFDGRVRDAAIVQAVQPNSPAEHAGLQPGDEILALNGERVYSYQDALDIVRSTQPGDRIDIDFSRRLDNRTQAVIDSLPGGAVRTATNAPDVGLQVQPVPAPPVERDRSLDIRRGEADRDADLRDRDGADDRRLFNRGLFRRRN